MGEKYPKNYEIIFVKIIANTDILLWQRFNAKIDFFSKKESPAF